MSYNLFIDDQIDDINLDTGKAIRDPEIIDPTRNYVAVKTVAEAINYVLHNGCPDFISFDHDLGIVNGREEQSTEFVQWLIDRDLDLEQKFIPSTFSFQVHSRNPIGKKNIEGKLGGYLKVKNS